MCGMCEVVRENNVSVISFRRMQTVTRRTKQAGGVARHGRTWSNGSTSSLSLWPLRLFY